jgi:ATP-dependent Lhr-like helicase
LSAQPYAYLDDAPLEERRTQAVMSRRWLDAEQASDLGRLDEAAIVRVREEAWPLARNADELHEVLMQLEFVTGEEMKRSIEWSAAFEPAVALRPGDPGGHRRRHVVRPRPSESRCSRRSGRDVVSEPPVRVPHEFGAQPPTRDDAVLRIVRGRLGALGPVTAEDLARPPGLSAGDVDIALAHLEREGAIMRGRFTSMSMPGADRLEWSDRRLLARIHRYTVKRLRQEIEPVEPRDFMRFLFEWQRVAPGAKAEGSEALAAVLAQLEGYEAPAAAWEREILPARMRAYDFTWLDDLCLAGRVAWMRLSTPAIAPEREHASGPVRTTPIALLQRRNIGVWNSLRNVANAATPAASLPLSSRGKELREYLERHGASFFDEMLSGTRLLRTQLEEALGELVAVGLVSSDSFMGLRALLLPADKKSAHARRARHGRGGLLGIADAGRWSLSRKPAPTEPESATAADTVPGKPSGKPSGRPSASAPIRKPSLPGRYPRAHRLDAAEALRCRLLADARSGKRRGLPPWRDLLRVYHRLEARGEIRGGRFVAGVSGEQFALPEAVGSLRKIRRQPADKRWSRSAAPIR